jgi:peroxiredoxin
VAGVFAATAVAAVLLGGRNTSPTTTGAASGFTLASTGGGEVALSDYRGQSVLLYFNEGVGCDACFYQTAMLEADEPFAALGVPLVPIVMNQPGQVQAELQRFGLRTPYLSDPEGSVSRAYDTLGTGHHADLPGHTFVLVGPDGQLRWRGDYPAMWVEPSELVGSISGLSD